MRIIPYDDDGIQLEDIRAMGVYIKAVPFEDGYVPAMTLIAPDDDYTMSIDELNCLMDGVEIARSRIDELITYILKSSGVRELFLSAEDFEDDEEEDDDI